MGFAKRLEHAVFGHLAGEAFDHQHRVLAAGDDQIEIALFQLVLRRERHELAVDVAQAEPSRCGPWNGKRREAQRGRGAVHRQHVAVVLPIAGQHEALDLHFVVKPRGKQRPDRPIHQPRRERFLRRRPAFALEEAAGKLAGRGRPLAIIASQREEVRCPAAAGRRPRQPARRSRHTAPGNCRRPAWPNSPVSIDKTLAPICFSTRTFKVMSLTCVAVLVGSWLSRPRRQIATVGSRMEIGGRIALASGKREKSKEAGLPSESAPDRRRFAASANPITHWPDHQRRSPRRVTFET